MASSAIRKRRNPPIYTDNVYLGRIQHSNWPTSFADNSELLDGALKSSLVMIHKFSKKNPDTRPFHIYVKVFKISLSIVVIRQ